MRSEKVYNRESVNKEAYLASYEDIEKNDFRLLISKGADD